VFVSTGQIVALVRVLLGLPKFGWLKMLKNSPRKRSPSSRWSEQKLKNRLYRTRAANLIERIEASTLAGILQQRSIVQASGSAVTCRYRCRRTIAKFTED